MKKAEVSNSPAQVEMLSHRFTATLLFLSFRYSQGDDANQGSIHRYIHAKNPNWKVPAFGWQTIFWAMSRKFVYGNEKQNLHKTDFKGDYFGVIQSQEREFSSILNTGYSTNDLHAIRGNLVLKDLLEQDPEILASRKIADIASRIIEKDHLNIVVNNGRPRLGDINTENAWQDPFLSHVVHFGLLGRPAGTDVFNEMFRDIKTYIESRSLSKEDKRKLKQVIEKHNDKHPDSQIDPFALNLDRGLN